MKDQISVCICTLRRNKMLERLLKNLALQETDNLFNISIIVIDNDPSGPARDIVMSISAELGMKIVYDIEAEQTIPAARNHALRMSQGNFIAIIDDDEFPLPQWLITLYRAIRTFDVDGALGPVHPFFSNKPPAWLIKGRFCERPVYRTGTLLAWGQTRTGNVLLKKDVFDKNKLQFDLKWKTSGSDRAFFKQAIEAGSRFIFVEEAPVYEDVPPERWTRKYYLKRSLVHGYNSYINITEQFSAIRAFVVPLKSISALITYAVALPFCAFLGTHLLVKCLEGGGYHLSRLCAIAGIELIKKRNF